MEISKFENNKIERDRLYKGVRVFPDLRTAIFANLKGYINGNYPQPLPDNIKDIGYYPLSMATEEDIKRINEIEKGLINNGKNT